MRFYCSVLGFAVSLLNAPSDELCVRICGRVCSEKSYAVRERI